MPTHLYAWISDSQEQPRVRHYLGLPPELTPGADERVDFPRARIVLIKETRHGVFLYRYTQHGAYAGDTYHESVPDAQEQAEFEYGPALGEWLEVPGAVPDAEAYVTAQSNA
jgi:hypothetical protein